MSLWAAVFDGVAGKAEFTGITFSNNTDIEIKVKFTSLQTGGLLSDGLAGRYFRYGAGSFRFRSSSTTYPTWVYTPVVDQFYDIMVECRSGGVELFIDGVSQGIKSGAFGTFNIDTIALFNGNLFADVVIERLKITDNTTASNSIDLFNEVVAGSSVDWPDVSANNKTITLVDTATDGSQWELIGGGGGVTVTTDPIGQPQSIEQITLIQSSVITIGGIMQPQSIEQIALSTISALSLNNLDVIQSVEEVNLSQAYLISVNPIMQGQNIEEVSLLVAGTLPVNGVIQGQQVDQAILSVIASLGIDSLSNLQAVEQVILSAFNGSTVSINDVDQQQTIGQISLSQLNVVSVDNLSQSQLLESINFNGVVVGYLQGALTVISAYNGKIKLTNPLTGEIRIL